MNHFGKTHDLVEYIVALASFFTPFAIATQVYILIRWKHSRTRKEVGLLVLYCLILSVAMLCLNYKQRLFIAIVAPMIILIITVVVWVAEWVKARFR